MAPAHPARLPTLPLGCHRDVARAERTYVLAPLGSGRSPSLLLPTREGSGLSFRPSPGPQTQAGAGLDFASLPRPSGQRQMHPLPRRACLSATVFGDC